MTTPVIYIREEAFGCGFDVIVMPQHVPDDRGWEFREHSQAMEWAEKLGHEPVSYTHLTLPTICSV